ncbi:MAG: HAD family hydrolase [Syntrophotaleaceae bacterium]
MTIDALSGIRGILFDLDGTLLNVEMNAFVFNYVEGLSHCFDDLASHRDFSRAVLDSAFEMLRSDDEAMTNEEFFLDRMFRRLGIPPLLFRDRLEVYFRSGLQALAPLVRPFPLARRILRLCFENNLKVIIATNPVFPRPVVDARMHWGRLNDFPFHLITSYENCRFCKPHPRYFQDILLSQGLEPEESLMVGNDSEFDLPACQAGIPTFLLEDRCNLGLTGRPHRPDFQGGHADLLMLVEDIVRKRRNR